MSRLPMLLLAAMILMTACNINVVPENATPTIDAELTMEPLADTATPTPRDTVTPQQAITPSTTPTATNTASSTPTFAPPTQTPTPTETLGPYVHVIQDQETLGFIVQQYGYDFAPNAPIIAEIVAINDNVFNADILPPAGSEILIPRQTATPITNAIGPTASTGDTSNQTQNIQTTPVASAPQQDNCHYVQEGETLVGIAVLYNTTLERISQLNPGEFNWAGCDFDRYDGGPRCNPIIQIGQCIQVPQPTPVPSATATASGSETPTSTPTYVQPAVAFPPENAIMPGSPFTLQWVSAGLLEPDEVYLVEVTDSVTAEKRTWVTRNTSLPLPEDMIPADGQPHTIYWYVVVAKPNENGVYQFISGQGNQHSFQWQSR